MCRLLSVSLVLSRPLGQQHRHENLEHLKRRGGDAQRLRRLGRILSKLAEICVDHTVRKDAYFHHFQPVKIEMLVHSSM